MSKGGSEVKETSQQRAMTEFAVNQLQDYTKRWLPLQKRLAAQTVESGAAGSAARKSATGRSNVDTQIAFAGPVKGWRRNSPAPGATSAPP